MRVGDVDLDQHHLAADPLDERTGRRRGVFPGLSAAELPRMKQSGRMAQAAIVLAAIMEAPRWRGLYPAARAQSAA